MGESLLTQKKVCEIISYRLHDQIFLLVFCFLLLSLSAYFIYCEILIKGDKLCLEIN